MPERPHSADHRAWLERLREATRRAADDLRGVKGTYNEPLREDIEDLHRRVSAQLDEVAADEQ